MAIYLTGDTHGLGGIGKLQGPAWAMRDWMDRVEGESWWASEMPDDDERDALEPMDAG